MQINFTKCHGSGNDFVLIQNDMIAKNWSLEQIKKFAKEVCQREYLVGADSLILIENTSDCDGKMSVYNADGSTAEMCGNALRCVARKIMEKKTHVESLKIKISSGEFLNCWKGQMLANDVITMEVEIGVASLNTSKWIPTLLKNQQQLINQSIEVFNTKEVFSAVMIPNPHLVSFVETVDQELLTSWGESVIANPDIFPYGMNVSMASLIDDETMFVLTYERGCGITAACGTAISSSCYIGTLNRLFHLGKKITVHTPGGVAKCMIPSLEKGMVQFSGNATFEYEATLDYDEQTQVCSNLKKTILFKKEQEVFEQFLNTRSDSVLEIVRSLK